MPDWSLSLTHRLQDVENDHVTIVPKFSASGSVAHPGISVIRTAGAIVKISAQCYLYDKVYKGGSFRSRNSSYEVPLLETYSWPIEWLTKVLHLTYLKERPYKSFRDRLRASVRTSIGEVGFGPDLRPTRVGDSRLLDAMFLLQRSISSIKPEFLKIVLQKFFEDDDTKSKMKTMGVQDIKLGNEIIGKSLGRLPYVTEKGHLVLSSELVRQGDLIALIGGGGHKSLSFFGHKSVEITRLLVKLMLTVSWTER